MPQPTSTDVHVDAILTNMSVAYMQEAYAFVRACHDPRVMAVKGVPRGAAQRWAMRTFVDSFIVILDCLSLYRATRKLTAPIDKEKRGLRVT